ncbi:MAG: thiamine-phosphate kinase [Cyanobacteriota bacterium]|nr:thiamine-phosphate kinase [Cyanobacteriota bacterium]
MDWPDLNLTLNQVGEAGLLPLLQSFSPTAVVGDDAAVLPPCSASLVVTTDVLVEGVHFSPATTPAHAVGWRAVAANLSDLAAMGSRPMSLVIGLGLTGETSLQWVYQLYQGVQDGLYPWRVSLVGGDLCRSATRFLAITALGEVNPAKALYRKAVQVGDVWLVTGYHGDARAGLELLLHPNMSTSGGSLSQRQALIKAHQYPQPRLDVVPLLADLGSPVQAGMDTSDGLADALLQMSVASQVGARIDPTRIPLSPDLQAVFPEKALEWALYGGEDFQLLLSMPATAADRLVSLLPGSQVIGEVIPAPRDPTQRVELLGDGFLQREQTFQHFGIP